MKIKTGVFLLTALLSTSLMAAPNFIVLIADDINYNDLGCTGNPQVRTPHIDALAREGINFTNAFLTSSSCSPSRCSIITGRYPHNNGHAAELHRGISAHLPAVTDLLQDAGYYTAIAGKTHMPRYAKEGEKAPRPLFEKTYPAKVPGNSGGHGAWSQVIDERPKDRPFFFWFAAYDAHRIWEGDLEWNEELYGPKYDPAEVLLPPAFVDTPETRQDVASYLNEVTRFDYFVGQVVNQLKAEDIFDETYLFVITDNGRAFPRAKTRLHDDGMKTYFIASGPSIAKPGSVSDSLISVIDLTATVHSLAELPDMPTLQGRTMEPVFADPTAEIRPYAFSEHNWHDYEALGRSIRDGRWLLTKNFRPELPSQGPADSVRSPTHQALVQARASGEALTPVQEDIFAAPRPVVELFDSSGDPFQISNLADDPRYAEKRKELEKALDFWMSETKDSVPTEITPDAWHRVTGESLGYGKKAFAEMRKDTPGLEIGADQVTAEGLR